MGADDESINANIDEITIWDIALSEEHIQEIMNGDSILNQIGLEGYWKFNSGQGEIAYDHSGRQNHGDISGATWSLPATPGENNSLSFDGDYDFVELADLGEPIDAMTVQFWLKNQLIQMPHL